MKRFVVALAALIVGSAVWADIPPPPPAAGFKRVPIEYKVELAQAFPEFTFFQVDYWGGVTTVKGINLIPKEPSVVKVAHRGTSLFAVPKEAVKGYATEKELHDAIIHVKVTGAAWLQIGGDTSPDIKKEDPRTEIVKEYIVEKIDPKEGIILRKAKKDEKSTGDTPLLGAVIERATRKANKDEKGAGDAPDDQGTEPVPDKGNVAFVDVASGDIPYGGLWVAGVAASLALILAGLWLVRRNRGSPHPEGHH